MSLGLAIQKAIFDRLSNDSAVTSLAPVFDDVDQNQSFPYISIGEDVINEWDTVSDTGGSASITIHAWSRYRGRKQAKEIMGKIYDSLHRQQLTAAGYDVVMVNFETETSFLDSDGLTRHGVQTYRILISKL